MELIGKEIEIGIGVESVRGTAPATASQWIKNISASVLEKAEFVNDEASRGVFEDMDGRRVVKKHIEGDLEQNLYANAFGYLAYNLYGGVESALVASGVYDHTFEVVQSSLAPSLSIFAKDGDAQQLAFQNCHVNTLELSATPDEYVKLTTSFIGEDSKDDTSTPSYATDFDFIGKEVLVKVADTEAGLVDATPMCLKEFNITFDRGLIADYCLGSYTPEVYASKISIEGSFQKNFEDETFKDLYLGNSAKYMQITILGEAAIGTTYHPTLTFTFNKVMITNWERSGGKDELVVEDIEFKAFYNATDAEASKLVLRNTKDEYEVEINA